MAPAKLRMILSKFDHAPPESVHIPVLSRKIPIKPTDLVVLAVRVVVSILAPPHFVPGKDHRHTAGEQQDDGEILHLTISQRFDRTIGRIPFDSAVPTPVVLDAVPIPFPV